MFKLKHIIITTLITICCFITSCAFLSAHKDEIIQLGVTSLTEVLKIYSGQNVLSDVSMRDESNTRIVRFENKNNCTITTTIFEHNVIVDLRNTIDKDCKNK